MSGALLQLAALSSQDVYLTGNPEITLFKKNYMRYTNFSIETVQVAFDGSVSFGSETYANLEKTGDLISKMVLVVNLQQLTSSKKWGYVDKIGHAIIDSVSIYIGGAEIDSRNNDWIDIYQSITRDKSQKDNYNIMIGNVPSLKKLALSHDSYNLFIPLEFWTGKLTSSAFPVCALLNNNIFQVRIKFRNAADCINYFGTIVPSNPELPVISNSYLLVDYVYLETEERNLFISNNHNYLIEVVDRMSTTLSAINTKIDLNFNKPTKYMIWYAQLNKYSSRSKFMSWATDDDWEAARNEFAKLVWLVTRSGLNATTNPPTINFGTQYVNIGTQPVIVTKGNTLLESLASKVSAVILFATIVGGNSIANATTDNVALISNTITFEDMSNTIDQIKAATAPTIPIPIPDPRIQQNLFMDNYHTNNIIDIFNYGNFINRTDNPIINSSFQLNGKNRFQERDGFFYNYLQPYYYFKNSPADGVNIYTFSLNPEDIQPSGTINLGNVDSKNLIVSLGKYNNSSDSYLNYFGSGNIRIFAFSYNNLSVAKGYTLLSYDL
jgi:hypothetical protein